MKSYDKNVLGRVKQQQKHFRTKNPHKKKLISKEPPKHDDSTSSGVVMQNEKDKSTAKFKLKPALNGKIKVVNNSNFNVQANGSMEPQYKVDSSKNGLKMPCEVNTKSVIRTILNKSGELHVYPTELSTSVKEDNPSVIFETQTYYRTMYS